ncbi:UNVERIFIED_CONTAM: hypothetical protein GTU68_055825 [Idotea baltica]|nr:hypothetical protein [Idotea baltica]
MGRPRFPNPHPLFQQRSVREKQS